MNRLFYKLYGNLKAKTPIGGVLLGIKIIYMIYTIPFMIFAIMLYVRTGTAATVDGDEKVGWVKRILFHFSAFIMASILWFVISTVIEAFTA